MNFENDMSGRTNGLSTRFAWIALAVSLGISVSGCKGQQPTPAKVTAVKGVAAAAAGPMCGGVDVHTKHIDLQVGCITCHPCGAVFGFDVPYTYPRGTTTAGGTLNRGTPPVVTTCSVACHSPMGAPLKTVSWDAGPRDCLDCHVTSTLPATHPVISNPTPTGADCLRCHDMSRHTSGTVLAGGHGAGWMDTASPGFHAFSANAGIASCQGCHGVNLDGVGGSATTSCTTCHGAGWQSNCTLCHGGGVDTSGAPPKGTWGFRTDLARIGAHTKHVTAGAISGAIACSACHVVPTNATSTGHMNGSAATVTWGGVAMAGNALPSWNRTTGTCASTSCHGGYTGTYSFLHYDAEFNTYTPTSVPYAGSSASPSWTGAPMTCNSCHANPSQIGQWHNPLHARGFTTNGAACDLCHPGVNATGTAFTSTASHVDGKVDVTPKWDLSCTICH